jgi:hypothetical protein
MRWSLGTRLSSYQTAHISMNVARGCDCKKTTINMEVAVTSQPTKSDSGAAEAFCANSTGPKNVDPRVVCDLGACILVTWFRGCGLKLSGLECGPLVGSCIHSNGSSGSIQGQNCCWLAEGKRTSQRGLFFPPCSYAEVTERCPNDGDFGYREFPLSEYCCAEIFFLIFFNPLNVTICLATFSNLCRSVLNDM